MVHIPIGSKFFDNLFGTRQKEKTETPFNQTEKKIEKLQAQKPVNTLNYESRLELSNESLNLINSYGNEKTIVSFPDKLFRNGRDEPKYQVKQSKDGGITVSFKVGQSPDYKQLIEDIFSNSKNFNIGPVNSSPPFSTLNFTVDGKEYILTELTGGFVPSSAINIKPLYKVNNFL